MIAREFGGSNHALQIKMPAHRLASILHLYCHIAIEGTVDYAVITDGIIAVQSDAREMNNQRIARPRALDKKRTRLWIAAERTPDAPFVGPAGINGRRVDSIARPNVQHRRCERREFPVEGLRYEFVALSRAAAGRRQARAGYDALLHIPGIVQVRFYEFAGNRAAVDGGSALDCALTFA